MNLQRKIFIIKSVIFHYCKVTYEFLFIIQVRLKSGLDKEFVISKVK